MRTQLWQLACLYWTTANLLAFALMGLDKRRARRGCWRISEKALFFFPVLGGSLGGMLGMYFFHHKTRHKYKDRAEYRRHQGADHLCLQGGMYLPLNQSDTPFPRLFGSEPAALGCSPASSAD
mgnify:CR=1 FL=1